MNKRYAFLPDSNKCSALRQHLACTNRDWRLFKHRSCLCLRPAWVSDTLLSQPSSNITPCNSQSEASRVVNRHVFFTFIPVTRRCRDVPTRHTETWGSSLICMEVGNIKKSMWAGIGRPWTTELGLFCPVCHSTGATVDTLEDFQTLTHLKNVGGLRPKDYSNNF